MQNLACIQSIPTAGTGHQPQGRREGRSPDDDTLNWESPASAAHADGVNDPSLKAQCKKFEKAEKALLRDADAYFAQRAAQEALSLLKANEQQIEQLHTLLEQEGSEDGR